MPPVSAAPRELLWYHQIQRETRHLLEQISKQQADLDKLKNQASTDQDQSEQVQQLLLEIGTKQATALERKREDFEREKEKLKRIGKLEECVEVLRKANESQAMITGAVSQWHTLEQRLDVLEQSQTKALEHDVQQLNMRIDALAREMTKLVKKPDPFAKQHPSHDNNKNRAAEVEKIAGTTTAGEKVRGATSSEELPAEREMSSQRPSDFVQKKRRPGEKRIPFRPTPADLSW